MIAPFEVSSSEFKIKEGNKVVQSQKKKEN